MRYELRRGVLLRVVGVESVLILHIDNACDTERLCNQVASCVRPVRGDQSDIRVSLPEGIRRHPREYHRSPFRKIESKLRTQLPWGHDGDSVARKEPT